MVEDARVHFCIGEQVVLQPERHLGRAEIVVRDAPFGRHGERPKGLDAGYAGNAVLPTDRSKHVYGTELSYFLPTVVLASSW